MKPLDRLNWAYRQELPPASKAVLVYLAFVDGKDCFPKVETIVACTGFSRRTVQTALGDLEARELIEREPRYFRGRRGSDRYVLSYDDRALEERVESPERSLRSAPAVRPAAPSGRRTCAPDQVDPALTDVFELRPLREPEIQHEAHQEGEPVVQQEDLEEGVAPGIESESWIEMIDGKLYVASDLIVPGLTDVAERLQRWGWSDSDIVNALSRDAPTTTFPTQEDVRSVVQELMSAPVSPPPAA